MPELPEVEQAARTLGEQIVGAHFDGTIRCSWLKTIESHDTDVLGAQLRDVQVTGWRRRAKWIFITLDNQMTLAAHLRMTGRFVVCGRDEADIPQQRVAFGLRDGREVRFVDQRKFGRIRLLTPPELHQLEDAHGYEPFDDALTPAVFLQLTQSTQRIIKAVLLDQTVLAGIGNIYADEALWRAQIHPQTPANKVTPAQATALLDAIQTVLRQALTNGGSTLRDYRDSYGAKGTQQDNFMAYDRTNQPCGRCGTLIVKTVVAQRGTHFCPQCQPLDVGAIKSTVY